MKYFASFILIVIIAGCGGSDDESSSNVSLSGNIFVASNTARDSDVNDISTRRFPNDNIYEAQSISNPVILGGYVNQPYAGPAGHFYESGDWDDFFEVDLRAGQIITLFVTNQNLLGNDLDLALLNRAGFILNASVGDGKTENLIVPADGHYFVQVQAHSGASNYVLTIGQNTSVTTTGMRLSDDFMSNEAILQPSPKIQTIDNRFTIQSSDQSRRMLVELNTFNIQSTSKKFINSELENKYNTLIEIKRLRKDGIKAEPNYKWSLFRTTPNDTLYKHQWNHSIIELPQAWDFTTGNSAITVAIPDTGVLLGHPDLENKLVPGYDFVRSRYSELDSERGIDSNPNDPGDQLPGGSSFHGTHVAGIIAAQSNNNEGIAGVSWNTSIMPLRALGKGGSGTEYDIEQAIRYAAGLPNDSGTIPSYPADIINLSLGGGAFSEGTQILMDEVWDKGVIVVAASGNEDTEVPMFPASLDSVISVGAIDINKNLASYSNYGNHVDVVAPGGDNTPDINGDGDPDGIISTMGNDLSDKRLQLEYSYNYAIGTSMAAPHVAGVISLMKTVNPNLTPQDVENLLSNGQMTDDLGADGRDDKFGYGLINAKKAVLAASNLHTGDDTQLPVAPPLLVANPKSLNFGVNTTSTILSLSNWGDGDLEILDISDNSDGILFIDGDGLGDYNILVDRSLLSFGTYTATITITSSVNVVKVPVILQVNNNSDASGNAGLHYILLVDPGTLEPIQEVQTEVNDGSYSFRFNDVQAGEYIIAAGSDSNNDGFICDEGEACGAFSTIYQPTTIDVRNNRSDIDFSTGFNVFYQSQVVGTEVTPPKRGFARLGKKHRLAR
ncbi:S8 family serine peptidase [Candidatus Halobeggiatoa sp. HSG11]|nr:S8 family serine peptidase [Candidatus Halobeggiatoa sp. HSG11]